MNDLQLAIVGFGKIAKEQHVPAIGATAGVTLAAVADPIPVDADVPRFPSLDALLREGPHIDAVVLATPPQVRRAQAHLALRAGKHVMMEKPPVRTVAEMTPLLTAARDAHLTLFQTWHARSAPGVEPARNLLAKRSISRVVIEWKEDVRVWHPGQDWIFEPGGFGVFDPGINALSILTRVVQVPLFVTAASLDVPANRAGPISAELDLSDGSGLVIRASFDFRATAHHAWTMHFETDGGLVVLSRGGARLLAGDEVLVDEPKNSYPLLYRRFVELVRQGRSDVDLVPLQLVADAFLLGRRRQVEAFEWALASPTP